MIGVILSLTDKVRFMSFAHTAVARPIFFFKFFWYPPSQNNHPARAAHEPAMPMTHTHTCSFSSIPSSGGAKNCASQRSRFRAQSSSRAAHEPPQGFTTELRVKETDRQTDRQTHIHIHTHTHTHTHTQRRRSKTLRVIMQNPYSGGPSGPHPPATASPS